MRIIVAMILLFVPLWASAAEADLDEIREWLELRDEMEEVIDGLNIDEARAVEMKELADRMSEDELKEFRETTLKIQANPREFLAEKFRLFTRCASVGLVIEPMHSDAEKIGLTAESVQAAVESRLRSARIYTDVADNHFIYINIHVIKKVFHIGLFFDKQFFDPVTEVTMPASTWRIGTLGTHGTDAGFILSSLSGHVDQFLVEYLRVNEPACNS